MENKLQEMQLLEQNIQNMIYQKQIFQMELSETTSALSEVNKSKTDVFKIIGQLMIKKSKEEIKKELKDKEKILKLRIEAIEKQEVPLREKLNTLKEEVFKQKK